MQPKDTLALSKTCTTPNTWTNIAFLFYFTVFFIVCVKSEHTFIHLFIYLFIRRLLFSIGGRIRWPQKIMLAFFHSTRIIIIVRCEFRQKKRTWITGALCKDNALHTRNYQTKHKIGVRINSHFIVHLPQILCAASEAILFEREIFGVDSIGTIVSFFFLLSFVWISMSLNFIWQ